jgi:hypothetical protein
MNSMAPPMPKVMRMPAMMFPMRMRPMDFQYGRSKRNARSAPVHAPVPGRGIAVRMTMNISPSFSNFAVCLRRVWLKSFVNILSHHLECFISHLEIGPRTLRMSMTIRMFPSWAQKNAASGGIPRNRPRGIAARSSPIGSMEARKTMSSRGMGGEERSKKNEERRDSVCFARYCRGLLMFGEGGSLRRFSGWTFCLFHFCDRCALFGLFFTLFLLLLRF